ncbi:pyridoxamine 5'-phosphate oxidase family protein [Glycomyces artemisiae]|uniref:Pyridoxamine 5'-phosphate oxidase-like protein n=1 Tax=Glycomyces artemisiae TaxID=1076443 RepID=A0A2T0UX93_9ACTN|nr:pyridoxamine 5'-phosphate oxidase family protein [Glycomyces artemisiae]PRY62549.1 pyridoxamine 5'-phosphate oxidase-like protein [Glycomyces artemisiae]
MENKRVPEELDPEAALGLLDRAEFGRVAFLADGVPTVRPVNHVLLDGRIVVFTRHTSALGRAVRRQADVQVAYQADQIDPGTRTGWSVLVAGTAADVSRGPHAAQLGLQVQSWMKLPLDMVIAIEPQEVTGLRLAAESGGPR